MDDGGRSFYQERNYSGNAAQSGSNSANERSGGYYYNERNTSFISAFSKADNERRRQFQPFRNRGSEGVGSIGIFGSGSRSGSGNNEVDNNRFVPLMERLPRGVRYPPNSEFGSFARPSSPLPPPLPPPGQNGRMVMQEEHLEEGPGGYFEQPYYNYEEEGPMTMGGDDYLYDGMFEY